MIGAAGTIALPFPKALEVVDGLCLPDLANVAAAILAWRAVEPERNGGANVGGWKSGYGALERAELAPVKAAIVAATGLSAFTSWAMINAHGSHHPRHIHYAQPGSVGGVFYVTAGDGVTGALLVEVDAAGSELAIAPRPGRLVMWRRAMWHRVARCMGAAPRISIAFEGVV